MKSNKLKLNLQLFTGEGGSEGGNGNEGGQGSEGGNEAIVFESQADLDSWKDKQLTKSLETAKAKWQLESDERIKAAKTEAEQLAQMSADEKAEAEKQKQADELAKREANITMRELKATALEKLAEEEVPSVLIDAIVLTDAETCNKSLDAVIEAFRKGVKEGVDKALRQSAGAPGGSSSGGNGKDTTEAERVAASRNEHDKKANSSLWG